VTDLDTLIRRIDQELEAVVKAEKEAWAEVTRANRERRPRLQRFDNVAKRLIGLLKPRLAAFIERFKTVVKAEPTVREHARATTLTFASTLAKVWLRFEVSPDQDVNHVRLECTQEIIPVLVRYDKQSVIEFPLDAVTDDAAIQWLDERIVAFVKLYVGLMRDDDALMEHLKEEFVEDPVAKIRFPKYIASSTLERGGRTYYFVDEETRQEFQSEMAVKQ
jgi:YHS domain-containing protein